jgi:hypothetical protein
MTRVERCCTRRRLLGVAASAAAVAGLGRSPAVGAESPARPRSRKMILSFYCDDASPYVPAGVDLPRPTCYSPCR